MPAPPRAPHYNILATPAPLWPLLTRTTAGGKDASEFWNGTHALLKNASALGMLRPRIVGLADGPPPAAALGRTQPLQYARQNWSGFVEWSHGLGEEMATPASVAEVQAVVRGARKVLLAMGRRVIQTPLCIFH